MDSYAIPLPELRPGLRLLSGETDLENGEPTGTLHDPVSNIYIKLSWLECECIARYAVCQSVGELIQKVNKESSLNIDASDVADLIKFLSGHNLLKTSVSSKARQNKKSRFYQKIIHNYLYFTIPLFYPQKFLDRTLGYVEPLLSSAVTKFMLGLFILLSIMTVGRLDEFLRPMRDMASPESLGMIGIVFAFVKFVHEWAHAYTATKYKVSVPHMGVAFIVLYPVLYTETTDAWRLKDKSKRLKIAMAGIRAEIFLATFFLLFWHMAPVGGMVQTLSFYVVAVSLVSSLMVNLNPLMRFDGYYILSDLMRIENMQTRACDFARYAIRKTLFALNDPLPESVTPERRNFLTIFGLSLLIYRFFLFSGIAVLVFHVVFQPLGAVLAFIEVWFFLARPILSECKIWGARKTEIMTALRTKIALACVATVCLLLILPVSGSVTTSAVSEQKNFWQAFSPTRSAQIVSLSVKNGQQVKQGEILAVLQSDEIKNDLALAENKLEGLQNRKRAELTDRDDGSVADIDGQIKMVISEIEHLKIRQEQLIVKAPFDGTIRDIEDGLKQGRTISDKNILFILVSGLEKTYTAFVPETEIARITVGSHAVFIPNYLPMVSVPVVVAEIEKIAPDKITKSELLHEYSGTRSEKEAIIPRQSLFKVNFSAPTTHNGKLSGFSGREKGIIRIDASRRSPAAQIFRYFIGLIRREAKLN
ncbi:MAG: biotin/lipoyl-binding protein [Pseudobdellovibrionaceae bacterium]|jgi:putative peptide zinc metalloprotease protein|nr:biotin/lipoyl-binding protein [Pseudobdellovibrionaceae bacterium]